MPLTTEILNTEQHSNTNAYRTLAIEPQERVEALKPDISSDPKFQSPRLKRV